MPKPIVQEIRAVDKTKAAFSSVNRSLTAFKASIAGLGATLATGGLVAFVKTQVDAADKIGKLSTQLGISTEALSQYQFVAEQTGVEFNTFATALQRVTRRISEAAQGGGPAIDALNELGLSAKALTGLPLEQQFEAIARQFEQVKDSSDRVRLAFQLFDSEGVRLLRTLDKGAAGIADLREEADTLGLTLTSLDTTRAAEVADAFNRIENIARSLARNLAFELLPIFEDLAFTIKNDFVPAFRGFLESLDLIKPKSRSIEETRQAIERTREVIERLQNQVANGDALGLNEQQIAATNQLIERQNATLADLEKRYAILTGNTAALAAASEEAEEKQRSLLGTNVKLSTAVKNTISPVQKYIQALRAEAETLGFTNVQLREYELRKLGASAASIQTAVALQEEINAFEAIQKVEEENARLFEESAEAVARQRQELESFAEALTRSVNPAQELAEELARIEEAFEAGLISFETYGEGIFNAMERAKEGTEKTNEALKKTKPLSEELGLTFASAFEDAIAEGEKLSDVLKALEKDIIRIITRKLVTEPLANSLGNFLGDFNFASIFGKAWGGPVSSGRPYVVGEKGPEMFVPATAGRIVPANETNQAGGVYQFHFHDVKDFDSFRRNQSMMSRWARQAVAAG